MKYDILTEHLTMIRFPMIVNEYTAEFQSTKTSKDAKFNPCLYLKLPPPCYEQNRCAECTLQHKGWSYSVRYIALDEVYCNMKIINIEVRVISRAEGKDDNSYRDIDNFAYHKNRIQ